MMNTPLFSILIAQYNNGKYFEDCYNSIIAQTYTNWEVIIVDDCSTDDSLEQMKKLIGEDSRFRIFTNDDNKGCGYTKKKCIELAKGEICGILDADDFLHSEAAQDVVEKHLSCENASIVYTSTVYFNSDGKINGKYRKTTQQPKNISVLKESFVSHFVSFKMQLYERSYGVSECFKKAVDLDLYIVLEEVGDIVHLDRELYFHRMHPGGISQATTSKVSDWAFLVKNYHSIRTKQFNFEEFNQIKNWYKYDLSFFSNWSLLKVVMKRILNKWN